MTRNLGKVYIVGAGPGDPELITVKGLKCIKKADCLLYDFLSAPEFLDQVKRSCELICVGKADGLHLKEQHEINALLEEKVKVFKNVVRLKGGDPFLFSRGIEEARYLAERGIEFEVVAGINSAFAAAQSFGIPLTVKNKLSSVAVVTGRKKDPDAEIDAPNAATLLYLMGVKNIANIVKALLKSGRDPNTPCAFIERATREDTRMTKATIATIEEESKRAGVKAPAVLIVGEVMNYAVE